MLSITEAQRPRSGRPPVPHPLAWYVKWVRSSPGNARQIEKLVQTFAMVLSDPGNLINMEGCWSLSKLYSFLNTAIINTAERHVPTSELLAIVLHAVQEVECLMEIAVRKYQGHAAAWNAMLALECAKCACNLLVHRQFFLVRWVANAVRLTLRRILFYLSRRRRVLRREHGAVTETALKSTHAIAPLDAPVDDGALVNLNGSAVACNGHFAADPSAVPLVIPRVVSRHRDEHRHYAAGAEELLTLDPDEAALIRDEAESVPVTWVDVLGMGVDLFMMLRPVLLVGAARVAFARVYPANASVARLPSRSGVGVVDDAKSTTADAEDRLGLVRAAIAASPRWSLLPSWRVWSVFALLDLLVVLLARFIRRRRVPVVYITDHTKGRAAAVEQDVGGSEGVEHRYKGSELHDTAAPEPTSVPAVVSRDSLRVQQALRNLAFCFLRDPFFAAVMRQYIARHLVTGFVNRIPLLGSLISYQVGYFLSMQHYSFLYSVGQ